MLALGERCGLKTVSASTSVPLPLVQIMEFSSGDSELLIVVNLDSHRGFELALLSDMTPKILSTGSIKLYSLS